MQALESAAFAAWPSAESTDFRGWRLRLDSGYTKRANSANATVQSQPLSDADIAEVEARFRQRGLRPVFRLTSIAPVGSTDARLEQRGWQRIEPSLVLQRSLSDADALADMPALAAGAEAWLADFHAASGKADADADAAAHLAILKRIDHPRAWARYANAGAALCCGLGMLVGRDLGLFDIVTRADRRRQGLAADLCQGLLSWGRRAGADTAFLQVVEVNAGAIRLYEQLGFRPAYRYWYRVPAS